ncbi:MAG: ATP-dependent zinc metalloprotease FtsH [Legionellaceae bacterium]|nr:ATP-dependent zinc metalloprotease FtsH [Legionellaceae bacterium]
MVKNLFLWLIIAIVLVSVFSNFGPRNAATEKISYSHFLKEIDQGAIASVLVEDDKVIRGVTKNNQHFVTYQPMRDNALLGELLKNNVNVSGQEKQQESFLLHIFINWFPMLLLIGVWVFFMRQMQGGGGGRGAMSFGRSRARLLDEDQVKVTFADVAGVDEAKEEVKELVDFLRDPTKFQKLGGRIPRGVLLVGSPGTGKTLLAKAVAGEAKVPFFTISGSDFVEMFVGVGASRVRDMFEQAKKQSPCIIFIDEIDAVGRHRGAGLGGGHDEREQTLNQLLVEMDGFEGSEGVIVIAATNRPDVLDPALLRPGRFDRQVVVPLPDIRGREHILRVHMNKVPAEKAVDILSIAKGTPGFSGADLANLINEAALFAARADKRKVGMIELDKAKDKIMMGAERRSMVMDDAEKKLTAFHEAGHALVGLLVPDHDPVYKVTIIPRGRALGVTMFLPDQDRYSHSRQRLESQLASLFGGRVAEELEFGANQVTTGASNDIMRATEIARKMVKSWGLSSLGPMTFGEEDEGEVFLGRSMSSNKEISDDTAQRVDAEVRAIIERNYQRAIDILSDNRDKLTMMAEGLVKYETIDAKQIEEIMAGKPPSPPADWDAMSAPPSDDKLDDDTVEPKKKKRVSAKKAAPKDDSAEPPVKPCE